MSFGYMITTPISIHEMRRRLLPYGIICYYQDSRKGDYIVLACGDEQNPDEYLYARINDDKDTITYFWRNAGLPPVDILQAIANEYGQEILASVPELYGENPLYAPEAGRVTVGDKPVQLFPVFAVSEAGEVVGESGLRVDEDDLDQVIT
jgi:hypothetical protein